MMDSKFCSTQMQMHTHVCPGKNKLTPVMLSSPAVTGNMFSGE